MIKLADTHWAEWHFDEVLSCYDQALAIFADTVGVESCPVLQLYSWTALAYAALEDYEQALEFNAKAQEIVTPLAGERSLERYRVLVDHARFLEFSVAMVSAAARRA